MRKLLLILALLIPALARAASYNAYILTWSPVVYYEMGEPSGTTLANAGTGGALYNLTTHNTPTLGSAGANSTHGTSVAFVGASTQYASVNKNDTGGGPFDVGADHTWLCWVNPNTGGNSFSAATSETAADTSQVWRMATSGAAVWTFTIFNSTGAQYQATSSTTSLVSNNWYMVAAKWQISTTKTTVYTNGVNEANNTATTGSPSAVQFVEAGRLVRAATNYFTGSLQDCVAFNTAYADNIILSFYTHGIASGVSWPFLTKLPEPPAHRDDNYWDVVKREGYLTGHFTNKVKFPQYFNVGYLPLAVLPNGNTGAGRRD